MVAGRKVRIQTFKIIRVLCAHIADDKASVLAYDIGGDQCVLLVGSQHGADIVHGHGCHQRHAFLTILHGIVRADAEQYHFSAVGIMAYGDFLFAAP